jgi:uncharacterized UBP type Zn finger protein
MSSTDIAAYTYDAEILCPSCTTEAVGVANPEFHGSAEEFLDAAAYILGIDRHDEHSFDSSTFPKVIFDYQIERHEQCHHCGEDL